MSARTVANQRFTQQAFPELSLGAQHWAWHRQGNPKGGRSESPHSSGWGRGADQINRRFFLAHYNEGCYKGEGRGEPELKSLILGREGFLEEVTFSKQQEEERQSVSGREDVRL